MRARLFVSLVFVLFLGTAGIPTSVGAETPASSPCYWKKASAVNAAAQDQSDLAGRLGSTRAQFEATYGKPVADKRGVGPEYTIAGCGEVFADYDSDGYLIDLAIYSPASPNRKSLDKPDPADWPIHAAFEVASRFTPLDSDCADFGVVPNPSGYVIQRCSSNALLNQVPQSSWGYADNTPTYGSFVIMLNTNSASDIYGIRLTFSFDDADFPIDGE